MSQPLTPALEDYLEVIYQLAEENGTAKISEIARRLNIAKPSVTQAIASLRQQGMVYQDRYGPVLLTPLGEKKAREVWYRHRVIRCFLEQVLKVSQETSDRDACLMEHIISAETFAQIEKYLHDKTCSAQKSGGKTGK
jgi:DtxR family Mn-dependent transcriptional regulator